MVVGTLTDNVVFLAPGLFQEAQVLTPVEPLFQDCSDEARRKYNCILAGSEAARKFGADPNLLMPHNKVNNYMQFYKARTSFDEAEELETRAKEFHEENVGKN